MCAIGVADRLGSRKPGKDGDLALFDGDPLEYTSHVAAVVIDGRSRVGWCAEGPQPAGPS